MDLASQAPSQKAKYDEACPDCGAPYGYDLGSSGPLLKRYHRPSCQRVYGKDFLSSVEVAVEMGRETEPS